MNSSDLRQLHTEFMSYSKYARQASAKTLRDYQNVFHLLTKRYPDLSSDMITPEVLVDFFKWLQTRERIVGRGLVRQGVKKTTVATYWRKLSKFFAWLVTKGLLQSNPLQNGSMEFPKIRYDDRKYLSRADVQRIFLAVSSGIQWKNRLVRTRNLAIISVAVFCGLRRGELLALRLADVDLPHGRLFVRGETSKSQMSRTIPLNVQVKQHLADYFDERVGQKALYTTPALWVAGNKDAPLMSDGLRHVIAVIRVESKVKFHLHQLRHTFAVNFLHNSGHNSFKLQSLLGQRSIASAAVYTRCLPPEMVQADIERMGKFENML